MGGKAEYRRVEKYYKTSRQYWKERIRRKLVLLLLEQRLSRRQIADRLRVSERTVKRDLAKIRRYYVRRIHHYEDSLRRQGQVLPDGVFEGMSLREQLRFVKARCLMVEKHLSMANREYRHHQLVYFLDFDHGVNGFPQLEVLPSSKDAKFALPLTISFGYILKQRRVEVGNMTVGPDRGGNLRS